MLSIFPSLLSYQEVAPLLLRVTLGVIFLLWSYKKLVSHKDAKMISIGVSEAIVAILLIIGLFIQVIALISSIFFLVHLIIKLKNKSFFTDGVNYYFILLIISLSLMVIGPGIYAFDLPL